MNQAIVLAMVGCLAGCLDLATVPCGDRVCPAGTVCSRVGCAAPADVAACDGLVDGASCHATNGGAGTCAGGACATGLCGNGKIDPGEVCDPPGPTCSADCKKVERCGDGVVDPGELEQCDDGNLNPADGCDACVLTTWTASAVVGAELAATSAPLANPGGIAIDGLGRIFIADTDNHRILRVEVDGSITSIAGTGTLGFGGDGGSATSALLAYPSGVAVDGLGRVFIADTSNQRIRRIDIDGSISTVAGTGVVGFAGDGGAAVLARLANPYGVAVDGLGRVFVADTVNQRIRRIDVDGTITTVAGTGTQGFAGDGGPASAAELASPYGVAVDGAGRIVVVDTANQRIRRIATDGTIATVAGTGLAGFAGDGGPATAAQLMYPASVVVDGGGGIVIADAINQRIRRVEPDGTITTIAGTGAQGYGGDGGPATAAQLANPLGVAVDPLGRVSLVDTTNERVRRIAGDGTISTVAGTGTFGFGGDGGAATSAQLANAFGVAVDGMGRILIGDTFNQRIRRVELDGSITPVAGTGTSGFLGDGGPATSAQLANPNGIAVDGSGRILIADTYNQRIRRIALDGTIATIAGNGTFGATGDGGPATAAQLANPNSIAVDGLGRIVIADTYNQRIRRIAVDGTITTIAGTGAFGYGGDGGPATSAALNYPYGVAVDAMGRVIIGDTGNQRIRRVELDGTITTVAGTGISGYNGDGGGATAAQLQSPYGVAVDAMGRILIADELNQRIRRVELDGTISTVAGNGTPGASGDAAAATSAQLAYPLGAAVDGLGRIVITDTNNQRIRRVELDGTIVTVAGKIDPDNIGPVSQARLDDPQAIVVTPSFTLVAAGTSGTLEAIRGGRVEVFAGRYPQSTATAALARFRTTAFGNVGGTAFDPTTGAIYLTEASSNRLHVITQVDPQKPGTWTIATLANPAGAAGFSDGAAATAQFRSPTGLMFDSAARVLYIADTGNHAIRALDLASSTVTTVVNTSHRLGFAGDGGPATAALLFGPTALTRCGNGDLFIADTGNNRIRRVTAGGVITTVLGDGVPASSGEGTPARTFPVDAPRGLGCDDFGNLYATSSTTVRLLTATDVGLVDGTGAVHTIYGTPPRIDFPASVTSCLTGLAVTGSATIQVADACTGLLVELDRMASP